MELETNYGKIVEFNNAINILSFMKLGNSIRIVKYGMENVGQNVQYVARIVKKSVKGMLSQVS